MTENQRQGHLRILLFYSVLEAALIVESFLLGWEMLIVWMLFGGLVLGWWLYISQRVDADVTIWIYFVLSMLGFFFYGIHETSIYDLAPVSIIFMLLLAGLNRKIFIRLCTVMYFITMIYDLIFVVGDTVEYDVLLLTRTILHFGLVLLADYLLRTVGGEQEELDKERKQRIEELEEINEQTEEFLVNVSHELRTPVNTITGFADVLAENETDSKKHRAIRSIQEAGRRLSDQIEDILDYTEIEMGRIQVNENPYSIASVFLDAEQLVQLQKNKDAVEVHFVVDPSVPRYLIGDESKIKKILKHLVHNAVSFSDKGDVVIEARALERDYGVNLILRITDEGIGIPKGEIEKLSERFYKSMSGFERKVGGLGLGLPVVYGLTAALGGFVKIESEEGQGTVVSVSIPQRISDQEFEVDAKMDTRRFTCPGQKLLLVDDEPMNLAVGEGIFDGYEMQVVTARSGMEAIECCKRETFDLIFLDHMMPEMDGVETLRRLEVLFKEQGNRPPVVAFTANATSAGRALLMQAGFDEFLSKPMERIELNRVLKKILPVTAIHYVNEEEELVATTAEAETATETEPEDSGLWIAALEKKGFDTAAGLSYSGDMVDFYKTMLEGFIEESNDKMESLQKGRKKKDFEASVIVAHSLKSTAKMIGAIRFSEEARYMEEALKEKDVSYIDAHMDELLDHYGQVLSDIKEALHIGEEAL